MKKMEPVIKRNKPPPRSGQMMICGGQTLIRANFLILKAVITLTQTGLNGQVLSMHAKQGWLYLKGLAIPAWRNLPTRQERL